MMNNSDNLVIFTGLVDSVSKSVLENVIGQLSDGMWENSSAMTHYWPFVEIEMRNGQVCFVITKKDESYCWSHGGYGYNYFVNSMKMNKDVKKIKNWFADKIKAIVNEYRKDYPNKEIKFNAKCNKGIGYMYYHNEDGSYRDIKVCEAYAVYKHLKDSVKE